MSGTDNVERRVELAAKVATLEERSLQTQKQLEKISDMLERHLEAEESIMHGVLKNLVEFKDDVNTRIENDINPIRDELARYKTAIKVLSALGVGLWALVSLFKDVLIGWLK